MITHRVLFFVQRNFQRNKIEIYIAQKTIGPEMKLAYLKQMVFQEQENPAAVPDADPMYVDWEDAQQLMDQLWNAGIRPSDNRDKSDIIAAKSETIKVLDSVVGHLVSLMHDKIPTRSK